MVEWWWLLIEAVVLIGYAIMVRGWARNEALYYAVNDQDAALAELSALPHWYWRRLRASYDSRPRKRDTKR